MASPNLKVFYFISLSLKALEDGSSTVIYLANRVVRDKPDWLPRLLSVNGLTFGIGQDGAPQVSSGTVEIDDSPGSFGHERRLSDLFERYTLINQNIAIWVNIEPISTEDYPSSSDVSYWIGTITGFNKTCDASNEILTINFTCNVIKPRYLCYKITADVFPNAPARSLGKVLPLIFGQR